jgi:RNA polymerase subunit RPABC4/transcription elongation factor Spt4
MCALPVAPISIVNHTPMTTHRKRIGSREQIVAFSGLALSLLLPFMGMRFVAAQQLGVELADVTGWLSDITLVSLAVTLILLTKSSLRSLLYLMFYSTFLAVSVINTEHIIALGTNLSLSNVELLFDPDFIQGSVTFSPKMAMLWLGLSFLSLSLVFLCKQSLSTAEWHYTGPATTGLLLALLFILPQNPDRASWRQANPIVASAVQSVTFWPLDSNEITQSASSEGIKLWKSLQQSNLSGQTIHSGQKQNVLLILIEGLSGHHVYRPEVLEKHLDPVYMPKLAKLAKQYLSYRQFISPQVQTNRGLYALLCGSLPNLISRTPKMTITDEILNYEKAVCLPEYLSKKGYLTSYLQSASLSFMNKDSFMPRAGFQRVAGRSWFKKPYLSHAWGVADKDFFHQSIDEINNLQAQSKPWFLTLLTVGTHHPYTIPKNAKIPQVDEFTNAVLHVDDVLDNYITTLQALGVLENTLVIITSDESRGSKIDGTNLTKNWVPLIVIDDTDQSATRDEIFIQTDIPLSIVDYLGHKPIAFSGRSLFRSYSQQRPLVFSMFYDKRVYHLSEKFSLTSCDYNFNNCYQRNGSSNTADETHWYKITSADPETVDAMRYVVQENDWDFTRLEQMPDMDNSNANWVGQYFTTRDFTGKHQVRHDQRIDFQWGNNAPVRGFPTVNTSIRWHTCLAVEDAQRYRFELIADDGAKLYVNDNLHMDQWQEFAGVTGSQDFTLTPGSYVLRLEYFQWYYDAMVKLSITDSTGAPANLIRPQLSSQGAFHCPDL